ncbi:MAG: AAA family ATPase, partial [Austwickia sp.]|nr:AAA family ATPase [Austwickia sp.]
MTDTYPTAPPSEDPRAKLLAVRAEVGKAVVGQESAVMGLVIGLISRGHVLLEGVPGVAKTLAVETFAKVVGGTFARIQ